MPMYTIVCSVCEKQGVAKLNFAEYDEVKAGKREVTCSACGGWASVVFDPGNVSFVLKDGESGGWISKATKENAYRARHNKVMDKRQRDHAPRTRLQPNVGGVLTDTWQNAKELAYEQTYEKVRQEHGTATAAQAAAESAKTYEPLVKTEVTGT